MKHRSSFRELPPEDRDFKSDVGLAVVAGCAALIAFAVLLISLGVVL